VNAAFLTPTVYNLYGYTTAVKQPVPDWVKPLFVIFDIPAASTLTRCCAAGCFTAVLYLYGNSGHRRVQAAPIIRRVFLLRPTCLEDWTDGRTCETTEQ